MQKDSQQRLDDFRALLKSRELDGFFITREDMFQGEEVRPADEFLAYLTGFTGSAGYALVLQDKAAVFSDSRYTIQLQRQLDANLWQSYDTAQTSLTDYLTQNMPAGADRLRLGYHSWSLTRKRANALPSKLTIEGKDIAIEWVGLEAHPVADIWQDRPIIPNRHVWRLADDIAGKSASEKCQTATSDLALARLICQVDVVNWLFNIRGDDLVNTPYHLAYALLMPSGEAILVGEAIRSLPKELAHLTYDALPDYLKDAAIDELQVDPTALPAALALQLEAADIALCEGSEPLLAVKACKNPAEISGFRTAHHLDALAFVRFWHWFETAGLAMGLNETMLAQQLHQTRLMSDAFISDSFPAIVGFNENGAVVHYRAEVGRDAAIAGNGVLLVDSGGQYRTGTTDVTRTFAIGTPPAEAITASTHVLAGHIELARLRFAKGTTGAQLDAICRAPLWSAGLDYGHGTGHGVGHILSVHEGPVSISKRCHLAVEEGHILSNEPGYYAPNKFGIRHENLILAQTGSDGFLNFETLTLIPFDARLIDASLLNEAQLDWLNLYHRTVYERLSPDLEPALVRWLEQKTAPLI